MGSSRRKKSVLRAAGALARWWFVGMGARGVRGKSAVPLREVVQCWCWMRGLSWPWSGGAAMSSL